MVVFTCNGCSMGADPCTILVPANGNDVDIKPDHCAWSGGPISRWVKMDSVIVSKIANNSEESK